LFEVNTLILIANDLGFLNDSKITPMVNLAAEVGRILNGLITSLKKKSK